MHYTDKNTYLSYSFYNGEYRKTIHLNPRNLNNYQIQQAIDEFVYTQNDLAKENKRMSKLLDSILNENANMKRIIDSYRKQFDSGN